MTDRKIVVVTGGSKGIGKAIAIKLVNSGYIVIIDYHEDDKSADSTLSLLQNIEPLCQKIKFNVSSKEDVQKGFKEIFDSFHKVDVLINCAGITRDKTFKKITNKQWNEVIDVNLNGVFNTTKAVVDSMITNNFGRIINISSIVGFTGNFGQTNYSASKAAIIGFSKSLALELSKYNISVNVIAPGFIKTEMTQKIPEEVQKTITESIPKKRFGKPDEIADFVNFIVSQTSDYFTGQVIHINGGLY